MLGICALYQQLEFTLNSKEIDLQENVLKNNVIVNYKYIVKYFKS